MSYPPPPPPPGYGTSPPPPPLPRAKAPWWKSLWFVGAVALIIGVAIGAGGGSGSGNASAKPRATVTATATAAVTAQATVTATPTVVRTIATRTRTATVTYTPKPKRAVNDGTYRVGEDINPGDYRTTGSSPGGCYWERDRNLDGGLNSIIANDNIDGPTIIHVNRGEYLKLAGGCIWRHT